MHALNERTFTVTYQCQWPLQSPSRRTMQVQAFSRAHATEVFSKRCPLADILEIN